MRTERNKLRIRFLPVSMEMSEEEKHLMIFKSLFRAIKQGNFIMPLTHTGRPDSNQTINLVQLRKGSRQPAAHGHRYFKAPSGSVGNYDIFLSKPTAPRSETV